MTAEDRITGLTIVASFALFAAVVVASGRAERVAYDWSGVPPSVQKCNGVAHVEEGTTRVIPEGQVGDWNAPLTPAPEELGPEARCGIGATIWRPSRPDGVGLQSN